MGVLGRLEEWIAQVVRHERVREPGQDAQLPATVAPSAITMTRSNGNGLSRLPTGRRPTFVRSLRHSGQSFPTAGETVRNPDLFADGRTLRRPPKRGGRR